MEGQTEESPMPTHLTDVASELLTIRERAVRLGADDVADTIKRTLELLNQQDADTRRMEWLEKGKWGHLSMPGKTTLREAIDAEMARENGAGV
jgi:hypothetical protein